MLGIILNFKKTKEEEQDKNFTNNEDINIKYLEADGDFAEASFEGTFNIPRLEPNGYLTLERFTLPNGTGISGELFIDSIDNAYFAFIPQLFIGNETFTALELTATPGKDSFDFSFVIPLFVCHTDTGRWIMDFWVYEFLLFVFLIITNDVIFIDSIRSSIVSRKILMIIPVYFIIGLSLDKELISDVTGMISSSLADNTILLISKVIH